jgi:hypothetical protein
MACGACECACGLLGVQWRTAHIFTQTPHTFGGVGALTHATTQVPHYTQPHNPPLRTELPHSTIQQHTWVVLLPKGDIILPDCTGPVPIVIGPFLIFIKPAKMLLC